MSDKKEQLRKAKDRASKAFAEGRLKEALKLFVEVVEGDPSEVGCFMKIGDLQRRLGNGPQAIAAYERVVRHYASDGLLLKAVAVCKLILTVDPRHTATQEMLADLYSKRSGPGAAKPELKAPPAKPGRIDPKEGIDLAAISATMEIERGQGDYAPRHAGAFPPGMSVDNQGVPVIRGQPVPTQIIAGQKVEPQVVLGQPTDPPPTRQPPPAAITGAWPVAAPRVPSAVVEPGPPPPAWPMPASAAPPVLSAWPMSASPMSAAGDGAPAAPAPLPAAWPPPSAPAAELPPELASAPRVSLSDMGTSEDGGLEPAIARLGVPVISAAAATGDLDALDDIEVEEEPPIELNVVRKPEPPPEPVELVSVPQIPLFSELPRSAFIEILVQMNMREMKPGEAVIQEGEVGDSFFVIVSGRVRIARRGPDGREIVLAQLTDGAFFGEMAILQDAVRTASVIVEEESQIFEIKRELLHELIKAHPSVDRVLRNFYMQRLLSTSMATHPFFRPFSPEERRDLMQKFRSREFKSGSVLLEEGRKGEGLYLLLSGALEVTKAMEHERVVLAHLSTGDVFGEMSLLMSRPTMATVTAVKDSLVLRLAKKDFDELIMTHPQMLEMVAKISETRELENMATFQAFPNHEPTGAALV